MGFDPMRVTTKRVLKKLGGDIERPKTVTFDGNLAGKETFSGEDIGLSGTYVKILDTAITADEFQGISQTVIFEGEKLTAEVPKSELTATQDGIFMDVVESNLPDRPVVMSVAEDTPVDDSSPVTAGTYVLYDEAFWGANTGYVSSVTYGKETIHPIDPKYLPGVCLPVVELTTVPTADGAALTAEESEMMNKAVAASDYVLIKYNRSETQTAKFAEIFAKTVTDEGTVVVSHFGTALLRPIGGDWTCVGGLGA